MAWRLAKSLEKLRTQVNECWPSRSKESDGSIGDENHSSRSSDHNPNDAGVVCAIDITHDPRSGCDSYALAEVLRATRDPRIKYLISNRKICASDVSPWKWRPYSGKNPHDHHVHISVHGNVDGVHPWNLDALPMPPPSSIAPAALPTLRRGDNGDAVKELQGKLTAKGVVLKIDGDFGPVTLAAVRKFQEASGLVADGIVGPQTWSALQA